MIFPVKVMDTHGKVKEEKCLTQAEALDHFWLDKYTKKTNNAIFALSAAGRNAWKRLNLDDNIPAVKQWSYHKPPQKKRKAIHKIICHRCGKSAMKTMKRAKYCSTECMQKRGNRDRYFRDKLKREKQNEIERQGIQATRLG
jgi:hypothetical protein